MSWINCAISNDYQIFTEFPYQIRRKSNKRIVKEAIDNKGYVYVCINRKSIRKYLFQKSLKNRKERKP